MVTSQTPFRKIVRIQKSNIGDSIRLTIPKPIVEKELLQHGIPLDQFLEQFVAVWEYGLDSRYQITIERKS